MAATGLPGDVRSEARAVEAFERIELRDPAHRVDLIVEPADRALVVVEGSEGAVRRVRTRVEAGTLRIDLTGSLGDHIRDAVTTSHTRQHLVFRVCAPQLLEVRVAGLVYVNVEAFGADAPVVTRMEPSAPWAPRPPRPPR